MYPMVPLAFEYCMSPIEPAVRRRGTVRAHQVGTDGDELQYTHHEHDKIAAVCQHEYAQGGEHCEAWSGFAPCAAALGATYRRSAILQQPARFELI